MEDITAALWGEQVSPATISELNQKVAGRIEEWRNRPLTGRYEYAWLDGIWLKRSWRSTGSVLRIKNKNLFRRDNSFE